MFFFCIKNTTWVTSFSSVGLNSINFNYFLFAKANPTINVLFMFIENFV